MTPRGRPATGKTPVRTMRIPSGIWTTAMDKATAEGRTVTDVVIGALQRYIATPPRSKDDQ